MKINPFNFLISFCAFLLVIVGCSQKDNLAGSSEIGNPKKVVGIIQDSSGNSIQGVTIYLIDSKNWLKKVRFGESPILDSFITNSQGEFELNADVSDIFNLQAEGNSTGLFLGKIEFDPTRDQILKGDTTINLGPLVMSGTGNFEGNLSNQNQSTTELWLEGTLYNTLVSSEGLFQFSDLPEGNYNTLAKINSTTVSELTLVNQEKIVSGEIIQKNIGLCAINSAPHDENQLIKIENLDYGDSVTYELLLIKGKIDSSVDKIDVSGIDGSLSWSAGNGVFKSLVRLDKGWNHISLSAVGHIPTCFSVFYHPKTSGDFFTINYWLSSDGKGEFQSPAGGSNDNTSAARRLRLGALLAQTAMSELMYNAGMGRKTFRIERDSNHQIIVNFPRDTLTTSDQRALNDSSLASHFGGIVKVLPGYGTAKHFNMISASIYDSINGLLANATRGSANWTLMGSQTLHTWPENLSDLENRFSDSRLMKNFDLYSYKNFRSDEKDFFWSTYSTSNGLLLWFAGNFFGASDRTDENSIMKRGFDHFNRIFMAQEEGFPILNEEIFWAPSDAAILSTNLDQ